MLIEVALLPKKSDTQFYTVCEEILWFHFYYGSGSAKAKSYGSYGFGSGTLRKEQCV